MKSLILSILFPVVAFGAATPGDDINFHETPSKLPDRSGLDYIGSFGSFLGTVVSKNQFLTTKHIGGSINDIFTINGLNYHTTGVQNYGELALWTFNGEVERYANINYDNPIGKNIVFWGNGGWVDTSNPIYNGGNLYGYYYNGDYATRWAENKVARFSGSFIRWQTVLGDFERGGLTGGDSGGPVFVLNADSDTYELIGVNYAVGLSVYGPGILYDNQPNYASSTYSAKDWLIDNVNITPIPEPNQLIFTGLFFTSVVLFFNRKA